MNNNSILKEMNKSVSGITLVALVITIIILIILAGVTIKLVFNDNGILNQTKYAKLKTEEAQAREKLQLVLTNAIIEKMTNPQFDYEKYIQKNIPNVEIIDDIVIVDGWAFQIDTETLEIISSIGSEKDIVRPDVDIEVIARNR